jgi:hypothetical protein
VEFTAGSRGKVPGKYPVIRGDNNNNNYNNSGADYDKSNKHGCLGMEDLLRQYPRNAAGITKLQLHINVSLCCTGLKLFI